MICLNQYALSVQNRRLAVCHAQKQGKAVPSRIQQKVVSAGLAALMTFGAASPVFANEFDLYDAPTPMGAVDDTDSLWKSTKSNVINIAKEIQGKQGLGIRVALTRRLDIETDANAVAEKLLEQWFGDDTDKKGVLLLVTGQQDGAIVGGKTFMESFSEDLTDSILAETLPYWLKQDKPNRAVLQSLERLQAVLNGKEDPGPPFVSEEKKGMALQKKAPRTPEQVEKYRRVSVTVVLTLLFIAVVVPMIQYFGYVAK